MKKIIKNKKINNLEERIAKRLKVIFIQTAMTLIRNIILKYR